MRASPEALVLGLALPPARPARLDGEPVDSLLTLTIDLDDAWSRGGLLMKGDSP